MEYEVTVSEKKVFSVEAATVGEAISKVTGQSVVDGELVFNDYSVEVMFVKEALNDGGDASGD